MKKELLTLAVLLVTAIGHASTVSWGTNGSTGIITANGTAATAPALAGNNWVAIGYFQTITSDAIIALDAATQAGTALLALDFKVFSSGQVPTAANSQGGLFIGNATNTGFSNQQIYMWAMQSSNNGSLALAQGSVQQQVIAYLPKATTPISGSGAAWSFPTEPSGLPIIIDADALRTTGAVASFGSINVGVNNASLTANNFTTPNSSLQLAAVTGVPEPSTLTFGALAALVAAGTRRRNRP